MVDAASILTFGVQVILEVHRRLETSSANDELRQRIERKTEELQKIGKDLEVSGAKDFLVSCEDCLEQYQISLDKCKEICDRLFVKNMLGKLLTVHTDSQQLRALEKELENAQRSLQLIFSRAIMAQNEALKRHVSEGHDRLEAASVHPNLGVYLGTREGNKLSKPFCTGKPEVLVEDDQITVKWRDRANSVVERYEVRYDEEKDLIVPASPKKVRTGRCEFSMSLGPPKIRPGKPYMIQVRATNGQGAGEWSAKTVARSKSGRPSKPSKPRVTVMSPTEVILEVPRLKEDEENGSPVHACSVEYTSEGKNGIKPICIPYAIKPFQGGQSTLKLPIDNLTPDSTYRFSVRMQNEVGKGQRRYADEILTAQLIPGPPQGLRVSSKRTHESIKIRWKAPEENPQVVRKYEMQFAKTKSPQEWNTVVTANPEKMSATARGLATDTKYRFQVCAFNDKGEPGNFSDPIVAETRCGHCAKVAAAIAAGVGGAIMRPLIGAVVFGVAAGSSASDSAYSKPDKVAAGAAAGISWGIRGLLLGTVEAPLFGTALGIMTFDAMSGENLSPQSSDNEGEQ